MDEVEPLPDSLVPIHSFVIKLWAEEVADDAGEGASESERQVLWRGRITHVPSLREQGFASLAEIVPFILTCLGSGGLGPD